MPRFSTRLLRRGTGLAVLALVMLALLGRAGGPAAAQNVPGAPGNGGPDGAAFLAQVAARTGLPAGRLQVLTQGESTLPLTGVHLREAKVLDRATGQEYGAALDAAGQPADGDAARQAEETAYRARYGKLQPALADKLATAGKAALPVALWVRPPDLSDLRKDPDPQAAVYKGSVADADAAQARYLATVQARLAAATGPVVAALAAAGFAAQAAPNAPLIAVDLPAAAITAFAARPDVVTIFDAAPPADAALPRLSLPAGGAAPDYYGGPRDLGRSDERAPQTEQSLGLAGANSRVAIVNTGGLSFANPYLNNVVHQITQMNANGNTAASAFAGIIGSTEGLARGRAPGISRFLAANFGTFSQANVQNAGAWAVANGANVVDAPLFQRSTDPSGFDWLTVYFDYMASTTWQFVTASAGMNGGSGSNGPWSPAAGWNVLAAGYLDDLGNPYGSAAYGTAFGPPTHAFGSYTNFFTTLYDHAKPDVLAKGSNVISTVDASPWVACADCGPGYVNRAEFAAAAAAGHAALVTQANFNYLKVWPEVVRAILLAGSDDDVNGRPAGTDSHVKGLDAYSEAFITQAQNNQSSAYWGGYMTPGSFDANGNYDLVGFATPAGGGVPYRVAMAWDGDPTTEASDPTYHGLNADLDMQILDSNGNLLAYSASAYQAREIIDFTPNGNAPYTIRIHRYRFTPNTHTYLGVASSFMSYLNPQHDASLGPCLGTVTQVPPGGGTFSGDTGTGGMYWDSYTDDNGVGPGWLENGPERLYDKYTAVQGYLTATLTFIQPGQDLDVFIVAEPDREAPCGYDDPTHPFLHKHLVAYGNTQARFHVTQPGWYGFIVDGYNGSAGQYTLQVEWKPVQPPSGTPLPTLIPTSTPPAATATPPVHETPATEPPTPTAGPAGTPLPDRTEGPTVTPVPPSSATPPQDTPAPTATDPGPHPTEPSCTLSFSDVDPSTYFYTPVLWLACNGVVSGYSDGTFRPFSNTTRAQFTKMVVLGIGWPLVTPTTGHFSDVAPGSAFYPFVETAVAHGIISGYGDGTFRPNTPITRGQLCKLLILARGWSTASPPSPTFADVDPTYVFSGFIEAAYARGIVSGYACGGAGEPCNGTNQPYFRPVNNGTRGQLSKMLYITLDLHQTP